MGTLTACIILPFILSISAELSLENNGLDDYRIAAVKLNRPSPYGCQKPGLGCADNCRDIVSCLPSTGFAFDEKYVKTCNLGTMCINGQCVIPPKNPLCNPYAGLDFTCSNVGVFPDPGDCKYYYMCVRENPYDPNEPFIRKRVRCEGPPDDYGFNPKTGICDKKLTSRLCDGFPIPLCKPGAGGPLPANPTFYYSCENHEDPDAKGWLYPKQYRCENGKKYSVSGGCK